MVKNLANQPGGKKLVVGLARDMLSKFKGTLHTLSDPFAKEQMQGIINAIKELIV